MSYVIATMKDLFEMHGYSDCIGDKQMVYNTKHHSTARDTIGI
jgi:hypothetical protein